MRQAWIPVVAALALAFLAVPARSQLDPQPRLNEDVPMAPAVPPRMTSPPELVNDAQPIYPEAARAEGRGGEVVLQITIDEEGRVGRIDVVQAAGVDLAWAAMGAVTNFEFVPAMFCVTPPYRVDEEKPAEQCDVALPVAVEWKTTFQVETTVEEVAAEDVEVAASGKVINFEGIVREAGSKDPLEAVEVAIELPVAGADPNAPLEDRIEFVTVTTDEEGRFAVPGVPSGEHRVSFSLSGYEPSFIDETFEDKKRTEVVIYLTPRETNLFETVVRRKRAQKEVAKISLTREEVKRVPGTFGDPLRVIENLPGLARAPFIGGALIVRGANPADSGVYFDGVEIPILYHFGGLTSVVNAEFLDDIAFYPGGFGAYYGRATAGIVDISSRKLKLKSFKGYAEVDLIDSGFFFGGPVQLGELPKFTFAAAARRSYIDALLPLVLDVVVGQNGQGIVASPVYWDYQVKVETSPLPGHDLSLFWFGSNDDLTVIARNTGQDGELGIGFSQGFHRLVGRWDWQLAPGLTHRFQPYMGYTSTRINAGNSGQGPDVDAGIFLDFWNWGLRDELQWKMLPGLTLRGGLDYLGQTFGVNFDVPLPVEIGSFPRVFPRLEGANQSFSTNGFSNASAVYVEAEVEPFPGLKIVPGLRGELSVFNFLPNELPDGSTSDPAQATLFHIDPRITARWEVLNGTTMKGAAGIYRQLPEGQDVNPNTGNPNLLEPRAFQLIGGVEQGLTTDINLDVQLYYTRRDLLVQSTDAVVNNSTGDGAADPVFVDNNGRGYTFGAEILLRHELTKYFYGWIAYTLSRTVVDLSEDSGVFSLTNFDQTHILTLVGQVNLPWAFTVGGRFRLVSGNPTGVPLGSVHDLDTTNYLSLGSRANATRLPTFHQLDIRVDRKFVFEQFSMTAYLDLLNVYNQANAEGFITDYRSREQQPIPSLPIVPVIGLSAEF